MLNFTLLITIISQILCQAKFYETISVDYSLVKNIKIAKYTKYYSSLITK